MNLEFYHYDNWKNIEMAERHGNHMLEKVMDQEEKLANYTDYCERMANVRKEQ